MHLIVTYCLFFLVEYLKEQLLGWWNKISLECNSFSWKQYFYMEVLNWAKGLQNFLSITSQLFVFFWQCITSESWSQGFFPLKDKSCTNKMLHIHFRDRKQHLKEQFLIFFHQPWAVSSDCVEGNWTEMSMRMMSS